MNTKKGEIMLQGLPKIARHFATSERTIRKWLAQGAPIVLIGRRYVGKPDEIWAWLIQNPIEHRRTVKRLTTDANTPSKN